MLAPLTEPDNRVITDLLLPLLASSTRPAVARAQESLNVAISTRETGVLRPTGPLHVTTAPTRQPRFHRLDVYGDRRTTTS